MPAPSNLGLSRIIDNYIDNLNCHGIFFPVLSSCTNSSLVLDYPNGAVDCSHFPGICLST
jgi:hypothetical protein